MIVRWRKGAEYGSLPPFLIVRQLTVWFVDLPFKVMTPGDELAVEPVDVDPEPVPAPAPELFELKLLPDPDCVEPDELVQVELAVEPVDPVDPEPPDVEEPVPEDGALPLPDPVADVLFDGDPPFVPELVPDPVAAPDPVPFSP
ncbi:hypothetical protein [Alicyclobacillus acidiphilus]|uniref:hypothetical protein n=1 Tax=Alicyclobacillus acidiphilus TaxID=182455 RepID=UPI00082E0991|nr:hypothetical protein [Alicyclobacillus acidiphilus]